MCVRVCVCVGCVCSPIVLPLDMPQRTVCAHVAMSLCVCAAQPVSEILELLECFFSNAGAPIPQLFLGYTRLFSPLVLLFGVLGRTQSDRSPHAHTLHPRCCLLWGWHRQMRASAQSRSRSGWDQGTRGCLTFTPLRVCVVASFFDTCVRLFLPSNRRG